MGMQKDKTTPQDKEKRTEPRAPRVRNYRVEVKLVGEPIYQFKVTDVSQRGAGLVVNESSRFLKLADVGQVMDANFISPQGYDPKGAYKVVVRHITQTEHGNYKGVLRVGIRILEPLKRPWGMR